MLGVRAGTLFCGVRGARWRRENGPEPLCQTCWRVDHTGWRVRVPDTLGHRLHVCLRTSDAVILRHNYVVEQMACQLQKKGFQVWVEERVTLPRGQWRPDLIVRKPAERTDLLMPEAWVLDPTIVSDNCEDLDSEHIKKRDKYNDPDVVAAVKQLTATEVDFVL